MYHFSRPTTEETSFRRSLQPKCGNFTYNLARCRHWYTSDFGPRLTAYYLIISWSHYVMSGIMLAITCTQRSFTFLLSCSSNYYGISKKLQLRSVCQFKVRPSSLYNPCFTTKSNLKSNS